MSSRCPYEVLEVRPGASFSEIRRAYERVRAIFGPSSLAVYSLVTPEEQRAILMEIEDAYRVLADPELRRAHDEEHGHPPPEVAAEADGIRAVASAAAGATEPDLGEAGRAVLDAGTASESRAHEAGATRGVDPHVLPAHPAGLAEGGRIAERELGAAAAEGWAQPRDPARTEEVRVGKPGLAMSAAEGWAQSRVSAPAEEFARGGTGPEVAQGRPIPRSVPTPLRQGPRPTPPPLPSSARPPAPPMPEITPETVFTGELLREVRLARSLTIQELANRTKISPTHLESLEKERWDWLPARVFVRGFLMSVARELGLDPEQVARTFLARREGLG